MIPVKQFTVPGRSSTVLRLTPSYVRRSERVSGARAVGLREQGEGWIPAEGETEIAALADRTLALFVSEGTLYGYDFDTKLTAYPTGMSVPLSQSSLRAVLATHGENNALTRYLITDGRIFSLAGEELRTVVTMGGRCAAVHRERIFMGSGNVLRHTAPLRPGEWSLTKDETGTLTFDPAVGDILAILSFRDDLLVFCTHAVFRLEAEGRELDFRVHPVPFDGGAIRADSVADCGKYAVFCTERGLCRTDGRTASLVRTAEDLALPSRIQAGAWAGKYYVHVQQDGADDVFVYDPEEEKEHFLGIPAELLTAGREGVYLGHGGVVYRLEEKNPQPTSTISLSAEMTAQSGARRYLDEVTVFGRGEFSLTVRTEEGERSLSPVANVRTPLPSVLRGGDVSVTLTAKGDFFVRSVDLHFRRQP